MKNGEQWLPIIGFEGIYEVSNTGLIRSCDRTITYSNGIIHKYKSANLTLFVNKRNGYVYVGLKDHNRKPSSHRVHRIVAKAFIDNPENLPEVNHEDFNKQNNNVENLKWCDRFYQNQHSAKKPGRKWQSHRKGMTGKSNPASKAVNVFNKNGQLLGTYESGRLAAEATGSSQTKVSSCCVGKRKTHNNLKFQFA